MPAKTFTRTVIVPQRSADGNILTDTGEPTGKPQIKKELGTFTFRVPGLNERRDLSVKTEREFCQFEHPERMSTIAYYRIMAAAHFPAVVEIGPDGFSYQEMNDEESRALVEAYIEGEAEVAGAKNSGQ